MRFYPQGRWQKRLWWAALFFLVLVGGPVYLIATRSSINAHTAIKLYEDLRHREVDRAEVEKQFGGPASKSRPLDPHRKTGEVVIFESDDQIIPGTMIAYVRSMHRTEPQMGELHWLTFGTPIREGREIVEVAYWDGPEGRFAVSFDDKRRVAGFTFRQRITWRYKVQQWLPWLP